MHSSQRPDDAGASPMQARIPNLLTSGRVLLAIVFFALLASWDVRRSPIFTGAGPDATLLIAAGLFVVAAITDALDGYLARRWKVVSAFGRVMDPFADKVLVLGAFVILAGPGFAYEQLVGPPALATAAGLRSKAEVWQVSISGVHPWMVIVILGRELLVTSIRGVVEARGQSFAATWSGKLKMILQCVCVPLVLVLLNLPPASGESETNWTWMAIQVLVGATVLVTAWSGAPYVVRGFAALRQSQPLGAGGA